ncbi:phage tail length tape measure family protein [Pigmentiphaga sp. CHJ604]|uniref:phage tail length tape measure family protein n=1 Tax=Pigmentiphaga sp. CHJ604 TaxID=3081984 RepID=UPI0030CE2CD1
MDEKRIAYVLTGDPSGLVRAFSSSSSAAAQLGTTVQTELGRASSASSAFVSQTGRVTASLNQAATAERAREAAASRFIQTLERRIAIAGKSETELLKMQAAELGVSEKVKGLIQQLEAGSRGFNAYGMSAAQTAAALRGVPAQITDIVVGLQGGQNVITVMLQQGGQLRDMFGGLRPALAALATTALSLVTPFTLGATALAAVGFAAAGVESKLRGLQSLYVQFLATDRQISTVGIDNLISSISKLPGVSRDAAKAMVQEFARLRDIAPADMTGFASLATNLAAALGEVPEDGAERLAAALEEPTRGAKALDEALGILSAEQLLSIQLMERHGDKAGAQKVLFDALRASVGGLADRGMTPLQRATHDFGLAWDETMGKIGGSSVLRGMNEWLAEGIRNVASFVRWLDRLTDSPVWRYALTPGGPFGWAMRAANEAKAAGGGGGGGNTGGASGSWGPPNGGASASWGASAAAAAANEDDDRRKKVLERTESYKSQSAEVRRLTLDLGDLRKMLGELQRTGQGESPLAKELEDRIGGISEKLESLRQKAERSVRDDAGQRMLQNIREQNAALEAQLLERDKLGAAARAQAAFEQQLADLRGKANLTVDQRAILAKADQIRLELEWGVALEKARAIQEDLAKAEKERLKNVEQFQQRRDQLQSSMRSAAELRAEQYNRRLSAFTMGDLAFQRNQESESLYREYRRFQEQQDKGTSKGLLNSNEYKRASVVRLRSILHAHEERQVLREQEEHHHDDFTLRSKGAASGGLYTGAALSRPISEVPMKKIVFVSYVKRGGGG